jgi:cytosine/adenosine deaminase-related metal-dependent hydrolase
MKQIITGFEFTVDGLPQLLAKDMAKFHRHFAESSYEIYPFVEKGALDPETAELKVDKFNSCWKVGHCMHDLHPAFERMSYSNVIKHIARNAFKFHVP